MNLDTIHARLDFLREAECLKDVLRSGHTSTGRAESTAEHSWRLCLMALVFADALPDVDTTKLLKLCVVHDLGEALHGDIPAIEQAAHPDKNAHERDDLLTLTAGLDRVLRDEIVALWDEYEAAASPEARAAKALDKLETILQHNQGSNPPDFDYAFNLGYGRRYTDAVPLFSTIRAIVDADTQRRVDARGNGA
ncbi:HD domain-containing protein [Burkholderia sp. LA-2-3-30-S1-D2]|uniref:HD domain-containing protein n=1 Tax=Burkholderia sp. LA-2-3-30-S1-D2 TaxID=1637862 RepID=UPI00075832BF|nr:HD domain-containing protein [Burkholderia sp. LA-2-3-30-S1-D2]AOI94663.1 phosphohydrolase [Burkholderia sp. LA-2-3-30-S1-D2]KVE17864.1 phosphohydrolase [Burkholderia sp. LA-2-3-30-S1-D2]